MLFAESTQLHQGGNKSPSRMDCAMRSIVWPGELEAPVLSADPCKSTRDESPELVGVLQDDVSDDVLFVDASIVVSEGPMVKSLFGTVGRTQF